MDLSIREKAQRSLDAERRARKLIQETKDLANKLEGNLLLQQLYKEITAKTVTMRLEGTNTPTQDIQAQNTRILAETNPHIIAQGFLSAQSLREPNSQAQPSK